MSVREGRRLVLFQSNIEALTLSSLSSLPTTLFILNMSSSNKPNVIVYGYSASPFYQKLLSLLAHYKVTFDICSTPPILPRPMLADELGITYRRIPILAIDGQLYFDTSLMVEVLEEHFADKSGHGHGLLTHQPELQKQLVGE